MMNIHSMKNLMMNCKICTPIIWVLPRDFKKSLLLRILQLRPLRKIRVVFNIQVFCLKIQDFDVNSNREQISRPFLADNALREDF
jgi:hypothetical protein